MAEYSSSDEDVAESPDAHRAYRSARTTSRLLPPSSAGAPWPSRAAATEGVTRDQLLSEAQDIERDRNERSARCALCSL